MADLSIVANAITLVSGRSSPFTAGEAMTAGQPYYLSGGQAFKSDANAANKKLVHGLCLADVAAGGTGTGAMSGSVVNIGAALTQGASYWLSRNAGGICPQADVAAGDRLVLIGVARTTALLELHFWNTTIDKS